MKIGIMTPHCSQNFGSILQAWALQKALERLGTNPQVIHYHSSAQTSDRSQTKSDKTKSAWYQKLLTSVQTLRKNTDSLADQLNLTEDYFSYKELKENPPDMDAYLTGSGPLWDIYDENRYDPAYFLDFVPDTSKKIAYGISIPKGKVPVQYRDKLKRTFSAYDAISLREVNTTSAIEKLTSKPIIAVADPVFLLPKADYEQMQKNKKSLSSYVLVCLSEETPEITEMIDRLCPLLKCTALRQSFSESAQTDTKRLRSPQEFLGLLANAKYIITDSFHVTAFSLLYEKPFMSLTHTSFGPSIRNLLKSFYLDSHIIRNVQKFQEVRRFQINDLDSLRKRIAAVREHSYSFLREALGQTKTLPKIVDCPTKILKAECYACKEICPKSAITMAEEADGFRYPHTDPQKCISCGLCEKVCIRLQDHFSEDLPLPKVYAATNQDSGIKKKSSSGGVFPAIARYILDQHGGCVAGARWNEQMEVVMDIAHTAEEAKAFSKSKYVKSDLTDIQPRVKELLDQGKTVLYSGLPCECAALRSYLRKPYENLYICEILCHSAPSPKVLRKYLRYLEDKFSSKITGIDFRDKSENGWQVHQTRFVVTFQDGQVLNSSARWNNYLRAFSNNYSTRESCNHCNYLESHRKGDLTLGDFWGVQKTVPDMYDEEGTSCVLINTPKGQKLWEAVCEQFRWKPSTMKDAFYANHKRQPPYRHARTELFQQLDEVPIDTLLARYNDLKDQ